MQTVVGNPIVHTKNNVSYYHGVDVLERIKQHVPESYRKNVRSMITRFIIPEDQYAFYSSVANIESLSSIKNPRAQLYIKSDYADQLITRMNTLTTSGPFDLKLSSAVKIVPVKVNTTKTPKKKLDLTSRTKTPGRYKIKTMTEEEAENARQTAELLKNELETKSLYFKNNLAAKDEVIRTKDELIRVLEAEMMKMQLIIQNDRSLMIN